MDKMKKPKANKINLADLAQEKGIHCIICQEGYTAKPNELLGIYVFVKRVEISKDTNAQGYNTVTHFNVIH